MEKIFTIATEKKVEFLQVQGDFYAYKETTTIDKKIVKSTSGIIMKEDIEKCNAYDEIPKSKYALYKEEILEYLRTNLFGESYKTFQDLHIKNPYDYFNENKLNGVVLVYIDWANHNIFDIGNHPYPKAIPFGYINSNVDNEHYNLNKVLEILQSREDIKMISDGISDIPFYNSSYHCNKSIEFLWTPFQEDWDKVKHIKDSWNLKDTIKDKIFRFQHKK